MYPHAQPSHGHELLTTAEMAEADRRAMALGVDGVTLMERAGIAVADAAERLLAATGRRGLPIVVLAGPGNNGGDGFVAARHLAERGHAVRLLLVGDREALQGDAAEMARRWRGPVEPPMAEGFADAGLVIDAMFGAGLSRPLAGHAATLAAALGNSGTPVLAVDVPSGVDGTTGQTTGAAVRATETITFFRSKPGHLLLPGRLLAGRIVVAGIGIPDEVLPAIGPKAVRNAPAVWRPLFPVPALDAHKYTRGHAIVVCGPPDQTGASRLAARAALRAGAGLVTVVGSGPATVVNAAHLTAVMVRSLASARGLSEFLSDRRRNAVLIGPGAGVGGATAENVETVLASEAAVVLDADALTSFAATGSAEGRFGFLSSAPEPETPTVERLAELIRRRSAPVVITPHEGELARLFPDLATSQPGIAKTDRALALSDRTGAVAVLKGPDTVIAAPDGRLAINDNAPPWLATAGSGDVLAGLVLGLLAQGMPAFEAACAAVWLHGAAASEFGPGLIAEDLPDVLPRVLAPLCA